MNESEQRIAIAEACGWRNIRVDDGKDLAGAYKGALVGAFGLKDYPNVIPDYLNDLNAIHSAWESLPTLCDRQDFADYLFDIVKRRCKSTSINDTVCVVMNALPKERVEAFLRTIGKWKE